MKTAAGVLLLGLGPACSAKDGAPPRRHDGDAGPLAPDPRSPDGAGPSPQQTGERPSSADAATSPEAAPPSRTPDATPDGTAPDTDAPPTAPDTDAPPTTTEPPGGPHIDHSAGATVRFIAVGDTGTGDANQMQVAGAMGEKCRRDGCDFVVLLGDNIYDDGPSSVEDEQWQTKFEIPYRDIERPFYAVLGNHDYATGTRFDRLRGWGYDPMKGTYSVQYTETSSRWTMAHTHYTVSAGPVGFLMLDTPALYEDNPVHGDQSAWAGPAIASLQDRHPWIIAAGHHTYVSNGAHGNAGSYDYYDHNDGADIKAFFDAHVCGRVDLYLSGHDHDRQWHTSSACAGTEVIVSGAGAKTRGGLSRTNPVHWQSAELGFLYVVASATRLTGRFYDAEGTLSFERTLTR